MVKAIASTLCLLALGFSFPAQAQGVPGGATHGFHEGNRIAGPVGAVVGGAVGGVVGGIEGVFGVNHRYDAGANEPTESRPRRTHRGRYHGKKSSRKKQTRRYR